jgi:syntaxin-binding protein 1
MDSGHAQDEMLGSVKDTEWSVLIMDAVTTKVMSSVCRISEVLDYGVSCERLPSPS